MGGGMGGSGIGGVGEPSGKADPGPPPVVQPRPQAKPDLVKDADDLPSRLTKANQGGQIILQPWDSAAPYLKEFHPDQRADWYAIYLNSAQSYGASPGFYADCSDFFWRHEEPALALRILSNLAEMRLDDATLLRAMAYRLARMNELDVAVETLEQVLQLRPEEPQSYRDLALMLSERADRRLGTTARAKDRDAGKQSACADYARAIDLLAHVVMNRWDARFPEIEVIALEEVNRIIPKAQAAGLSKIPLDRKLIKLLDADLRIVMTWDADNTKVNLQVTEPSGEPASPEHRETTIGGIVSPDFSAGYGPERYMVRKAIKGIYKIEACGFSNGPNTLRAPVTVQVDVFTNYGRANELHQSLTVRLQRVGDHVTVGRVKFNLQRKPSLSREEEQ
jgi:tetratricopeptide (TPR) repeat protein